MSLPKPRLRCCACSTGRASGTCLPPAAPRCRGSADSKAQPPHGPKSLEEWKRFWGGAEADSLEGHAPISRRRPSLPDRRCPRQLTPDDFRLRPDSPGYRAGKDGKDLGADVDLVGPGPAYERWKKTPEYQQWLKDTGQFKAEAPKPEPKAFVLLGGKGVAERKFDTLAEAVQGASDGDTIEIRGNGPFVSQPITIEQARAGDPGRGRLQTRHQAEPGGGAGKCPFANDLFRPGPGRFGPSA